MAGSEPADNRQLRGATMHFLARAFLSKKTKYSRLVYIVGGPLPDGLNSAGLHQEWFVVVNFNCRNPAGKRIEARICGLKLCRLIAEGEIFRTTQAGDHGNVDCIGLGNSHGRH